MLDWRVDVVMDKVVNIGIVDQHPLMREGIISTFAGAPDFNVVGAGCSYAEATHIASVYMPDLMLLEVDLPGGGLNAARLLRVIHPKLLIVFLTASEQEEYVKAALTLGVRGYILKGICGSDLLKALRLVTAGETYITPALAITLLSSPNALNRPQDSALKTDANLSVREEQILQGVAKGMKNREIALELQLSEKTIKNYMSGILFKLKSRNRVQAVFAANRRLRIN